MADAWLSWVLQGSPVNRLLQEKKKKAVFEKLKEIPQQQVCVFSVASPQNTDGLGNARAAWLLTVELLLEFIFGSPSVCPYEPEVHDVGFRLGGQTLPTCAGSCHRCCVAWDNNLGPSRFCHL